MDASWIIKSSFSLFSTKLAINQQENYPIFLMIFWFSPQKMQEKVSKSWNADKNGLGKYLSMNFRHFLLSFNPFWRSSDFLDNIGPSRSLWNAWAKLLSVCQLVILGLRKSALQKSCTARQQSVVPFGQKRRHTDWVRINYERSMQAFLQPEFRSEILKNSETAYF